MKLIFMGDSTMQYNSYLTYPQVGWPQALPLFLNDDVIIKNFAKNGCSTKSFIDLGLFKLAIDECKKGDYCLIQFGHNDAKIDNPLRYTDPNTTYKENLKLFIKGIREKGGIPILLTSIYRRFFDENGIVTPNCHLGYPQAMKEVAKDEKVELIDMCTITKDFYQSLGDEASKRLFMYFEKDIYSNYIDGLHDNTHLRFDGAYEISRLFIEEVKKMDNDLKSGIRKEVK